MKLLRHIRDYDLLPLLSVILVCAFPCIFMYARNASETTPAGMLPFLLIFGCNSLLLLMVTAPCFMNFSRAAFFTDAAMLVIINFTLAADKLEQLFPWLWSRYLLVLCAAALLALFVLLLLRKPDLRIGCTLVTIAFGAVILMNLAIAAPTIISSLKVTKPDVEPETDTGVVFSDNHPNVYYFMFDEYGGYENLLQYYDYDNSAFLEQLEDRGFSVARESRNTEAVYTDILLPNLLNLDYVMDVDDYGILSKYYLNDSFMVRMFRQNGYQVNLADHLNFIGSTGCSVLTSGQTETTISWYLLKNSLYWKIDEVRSWLNSLFHMDANTNYYQGLMNALDVEINSWMYTGNTPTLTIGYVQCPHSPLAVGRHGEKLAASAHYNWNNPRLYLDQLEFISDHILQLVDTIQQHDPDAVIILQSDHGARWPIHMIQIGKSDWYDPYTENTYMQNVLNCVYYKGNSYKIDGETGINTLRLVFSDVLGANLEPIEPVYNYYNVSDNITPFQ